MIEITFSTLSTILFSIIFYFLLRFIIKPLLRVRFYAKQGFTPIYVPIVGGWSRFDIITQKYGDALYQLKQTLNNKKDFIGIATTLGDRPLLVLADAKYIKAMVKQDSVILYKNEEFIWPMKNGIHSRDLTFAEGEVHRKLRKIHANFLTFECLNSSIPTMMKVTEEILHSMETSGLSNVNVMQIMHEMSGEVMSRVFMGCKQDYGIPDGQSLADMSTRIQVDWGQFTQNFLYQIFGPAVVKLRILSSSGEYFRICKDAKRGFESQVESRMRKLQEKPTSDTALFDQLLLDLIEKKAEALTFDEIVDQYSNMYIAGLDAPAHVLALGLYLLAKHPEHYERIEQEIKEKISDVKNLSYNVIGELDYTNAFIKEIMRLYAPFQMLFFREAKKDFMLEDKKVKKGTLLNVYLCHAALSEKYFAEVEKFDPSRWLKENSNKYDPMSNIPFYAGIRSCIGQQFAMLEMKIALVLIVSKYRLEMDPDYELKMTIRLLYEPALPIKMNFILKK